MPSLNAIYRHSIFGTLALLGFLAPRAVLAQAPDVPVSVSRLEGNAIRGSLESINGKSLSLVGGQKIPLETIQSISLNESPDATPPRPRAALIDGSRIAFERPDDLPGDVKEQVELKLRRSGRMRIPLDRFQWIRFRAPKAEVNAQWDTIVRSAQDPSRRKDTLVVRRSGETIDSIDGLVVGVGKTEIRFDIDGQTIAAPLSKLEGIVFAASRRQAQQAKMEFEDIYGSVWQLTDINTDGGELQLSLAASASLQHRIPLSHFQSLLVSGSVIPLLSDDIADSGFRSMMPTKMDASLIAAALGPRVKTAPSGVRFLEVPAGGFVEYRIPRDAATLVGSVSASPDVSRGDICVASLMLDGKVAWTQEIRVDARPTTFRIPVGDAARVRIQVSPGKGEGGDTSDFGDLLRFESVRLLKS
ncbi:MAG: hypothetical protein AAFN70_01360 [Planctomycetota bacterium]